MVICGDSAEVLPTLESESADALVTDPPAGISFMGAHWDSDKGGRDEWVAWLGAQEPRVAPAHYEQAGGRLHA